MSRSTGLARGGLASLLLAGSMPALAQAEANLGSAAAQEAMVPNSDEEIIVTGRAGAGERTKLETSYAVTTLDNETLRSRAASSVTETLKSVPGF